MFSFFLEVYIFYLFTLIFLGLFFFQNEISFFLIIFQLHDLHMSHPLFLVNFTIFLNNIIIIPFRNSLIILILHFRSLIFNFQFNNLYYNNLIIIIILLCLTYYY